MQRPTQSAIEALTHTVAGYALGVLVGQWILYPLYGVHVSWRGNATMTLWFCLISLGRSYLLRRVFNWWHR